MKHFVLSDVRDWQAVVDEILPLQHPVLLLKGNLGAGKTTFTQFLLAALGSNDNISSPTYSIVNEYQIPGGKVYHFDLYRMKNIGEVYDIGMDEYLSSGQLCIIEWPDVYEAELEDIPHHTLIIENSDSKRTVDFI